MSGWLVGWSVRQTESTQRSKWDDCKQHFLSPPSSHLMHNWEYWPILDKLSRLNKILYHHTKDYFLPLGLLPVQSFQMSNLIQWIQLLPNQKFSPFCPHNTNWSAISVKHTKWWAGIAWKLEVARLIKIKINPYPMPSLNGLLWYCGDCLDAQWKWEEWSWY